MTEPVHRRRGRPLKFGHPGEVVAVTLPRGVIARLRKIHPDLGWAIVALAEGQPPVSEREARRPSDADLVSVAGGRSLIVVNIDAVKNLEGIDILRLNGRQGFLAFPPGAGLAELEVAIVDRLDEKKGSPRELAALSALRLQIKKWRRDPSLRFGVRSIIVAERKRLARKM